MTKNDVIRNPGYTPVEMSDAPQSNVEDKVRRVMRDTLKEYPSLRVVKRVVVSVIGGTVLLIGVVLLVLPGPALIVIPSGLAVLALEFRWARRWLRKAKSIISKNTSDGEESGNHSNSPEN